MYNRTYIISATMLLDADLHDVIPVQIRNSNRLRCDEIVVSIQLPSFIDGVRFAEGLVDLTATG